MATASCTDLTELNENPTKSETIDPNILIPTIQFSHALGYNNVYRYMTYPGGWCNHWTGAWGMVEYGGKAKKNLGYMERLWVVLYPEAVKNLVSLEELTKSDPEYVNLNAIAKVLRVETFLKLTDYYGDVPYFEAGQAYFQNILNPKYDKQEDIYKDFFKLLDEAVAQFDASAPKAKNDLYYDGNVEQWKRFASSLKLRIAMRLVKVDEALAKQKAKEAFTAGLMQSNSDIAYVKYSVSREDIGSGNGYSNYFVSSTSSTYATYGPTQNRITTDFFNALTVRDTDSIVGSIAFRRLKSKDPRLHLIAKSYHGALYDNAIDITEICRAWNSKATNQQGPADLSTKVDGYINVGGYLTVPSQEFNYGGGIQRENSINLNRSVWANAITNVQAPTLPSASVTHYLQRLMPSKWLLASDAPWIHMSYAETQFLLAETTLRGWNIDNESVEDRYKKGYIAAVKQFSLFGASTPADTEIESYMNTYLLPSLSAGTTQAMEEIAKQLWILFCLDPIEAWSLIRRTNGMPTEYTTFYNRYPNENESNGKMPRRMQYPLEEQTRNKNSYEEAIARMGGTDDWMTRVWWDKE